MRAWPSCLCRHGGSSNSQFRLPSISLSHLEHNPDASLSRARRVLREIDSFGRATRGRERAPVRRGRDGDRQADVDEPPRRSIDDCGAGLERARGARPPAGRAVVRG